MYQLCLSLATSTKPNSQWLKQGSVYFSHITEDQRWEVLDRLSECRPYHLQGVGFCLHWLMITRWPLQLQISSPCSRKKQEKEWLCLSLSLLSGKLKSSRSPTSQHIRYFSHWPTLSQIATKESGRWSGHVVTSNKNEVLFTMKKRELGFVLATNRVCMHWSGIQAEAGSHMEGPTVCVFVSCWLWVLCPNRKGCWSCELCFPAPLQQDCCCWVCTAALDKCVIICSALFYQGQGPWPLCSWK